MVIQDDVGTLQCRAAIITTTLHRNLSAVCRFEDDVSDHVISRLWNNSERNCACVHWSMASIGWSPCRMSSALYDWCLGSKRVMRLQRQIIRLLWPAIGPSWSRLNLIIDLIRRTRCQSLKNTIRPSYTFWLGVGSKTNFWNGWKVVFISLQKIVKFSFLYTLANARGSYPLQNISVFGNIGQPVYKKTGF